MGVDDRQSGTFFISLGVAVLSQIEDDPRVTPSVILNWLPHERWAVRVGAVPASGGAAAAGELKLEDRNGNQISSEDYDPAPCSIGGDGVASGDPACPPVCGSGVGVGLPRLLR